MWLVTSNAVKLILPSTTHVLVAKAGHMSKTVCVSAKYVGLLLLVVIGFEGRTWTASLLSTIEHTLILRPFC